ncbi:hypothetical protein [Methanobrevibacter sp.]|uniref:hypothetical protein n=1 Tax=Methanobrevibacter sp. TaxID=66852 RepID=UPI0038669CEA
MNKKKILILIILSIFIVGMVMGTASASHTFKAGKYKGTISDKQYKSLQTAKKKGKAKYITVKTKQYKTKKVAKYKTVKTKKWLYKDIEDGYYTDDGAFHSVKSAAYKKYQKEGWTEFSSYSKTVDGKEKSFTKFGKKITTTKKVKNGYKKVKKPIYMTVATETYKGKFSGDSVWFGLDGDFPLEYKRISIKAKSPLKKYTGPTAI